MVKVKIKVNAKKLALFALPFVAVITTALLFYSSPHSATVSNSSGVLTAV